MKINDFWVFFFLANTNLLKYHFWDYYKYKYILAYIGQYECKFDNLDWYFKIQTQIWINSTQNKLYAYKYKCYKSMQIIIHMCGNIWYILLD